MPLVPPPPAYMFSDSPPSYDEVVKKVDGLVGSSPTPQKYLNAALALTGEERAVLQAGAEEHNPLKTEADKKKYTLGAAKELSTDETKQKLKEEANSANEAARDIENVFVSLQLKIAQIDQIHKSNFAPTLVQHRFDAIIVKFCADERLSVDQRLSKINDFIARANEYKQSASTMESDFKGLTDDFAGFIATFSQWAKDKEGELTAEIKKINEELVELNAVLARLYLALIGLGAGMAVGLPVIGIGAIMAGPAAGLVIIGGLIFFGATSAAIAAIAISVSVLQGQIRDKEKERSVRETQVEQIQQARLQLTQLGEEKYQLFSKSINSLASYWTYTVAEAEKIKKWLEDGAKFATLP
ncbi:hypothetical protein ESCO_006790 [Escovopsis weberi]|uniref:Uncharacterized protein n=1 Tax=Escovopsis weberi TaxID=150374 RepID=A0A0M9VVR6_ESCWE|nr:hypothetical protein ESCO_006790 [Escovopsis weberi]